MDGLSVAASVIAVIQISRTIFSTCSHYLTAVINAEQDIKQLQWELTTLMTVLDGARILLEGPNASRLETSQKFRGTLDDCSLQLQSLAVALQINLETGSRRKMIGRFKLRRFKWPFDNKEAEDTIQSIHKSRELLSTFLNIDQTYVTNHSVSSNQPLTVLSKVSPS